MKNENDKDDEMMVILTEAGTELDAEIIKSQLEEANIKSNLISNIDSTRMMMIGKNAVVKVFVAKKDLEAAEEILDNISFDMPDNIDVGEEEK